MIEIIYIIVTAIYILWVFKRGWNWIEFELDIITKLRGGN